MQANLSYMISRVAAVTTQTFKLNPQNSTSASSGSIVRFSLPSNTLLNTKSIKMFMRPVLTGNNARLPAKIDSLIDRVSLESGGVTIDGSGLNHYGLLRHAKDALMGNHTDTVLGHPEMVRAVSYHTGGAAIAADSQEVIAANQELAVCNWEGFLGSCAPSIIDTA